MDYKEQQAFIREIYETAESNSKHCQNLDIQRSAHTEGMIAGLCTAMKHCGHEVDYGSQSDGNGCMRAAQLVIDDHTLLRNGAIQQDGFDRLMEYVVPPSKISVYQINLNRDTQDAAFVNLRHLEEVHGRTEIDSSIYDRVYTAELHCNGLESIFSILNTNPPADYRARSLSVSDVVEVIESDVIPTGTYFCDSTCFLRIPFDTGLTQDGPAYNLRAAPPGHFLEESAWGNNPVPQNVQALIDAYDQQMKSFISENHLDYAANADTIQAHADDLWKHYQACDTIGGIRSDWDATEKYLVKIEPEKEPTIIEMMPTLDNLQTAVAGYVEAVYPYEDPVAIIVNEEGKVNNLPLNRALRDDTGEIYDVTAGAMVIVGLGEDSFAPLNRYYAEKYSRLFKSPELFAYIGGSIVVTKVPPRKRTPQEDMELARKAAQSMRRDAPSVNKGKEVER